jgi:hypothetical protein
MVEMVSICPIVGSYLYGLIFWQYEKEVYVIVLLALHLFPTLGIGTIISFRKLKIFCNERLRVVSLLRGTQNIIS